MLEDMLDMNGGVDANELQPAPEHEEVLGLESEGPKETFYVILDTAILDSVDFNELVTTSFDTARKSIDETKFVVKFIGAVPQSLSTINNLVTYTHEEIVQVLQSEEWVPTV